MGLLDNIQYIPCNPANHGGTRTKNDIEYLVYHYTGNDGDNAINNCMYYKKKIVKASAHYFVDDTCVIQSVLDLISAWAVGGRKWNDCDETGGGKLFGKVTNRNSISIEMCDTRRNGELMATEETLSNAIELGKMLMQKYDIPIERVIRHFDVSGKHCPAYFMDETKWNAFKARLVEEEMVDINKLIRDLTPEQAYKIYAKAEQHMATLPLPTSWDAASELREAKELGITDGVNPMCPATRLQVAIMAKRAVKK